MNSSITFNAIKVTKNSLRKEMKFKLKMLTDEDKLYQSNLIQEKLFTHELFINCKRLSIFLNMPDEVHTLPIVKHALECGKICFIPRYDSKSSVMDMVRLHSWQEYESLPLTTWNIKQPSLDQKCEDALGNGGLDLMLVPGLAFSMSGQRLGRGRGYYDSYIAKCRNVCSMKTMALAFKEQIVGNVPVDELDAIIDIVLVA